MAEFTLREVIDQAARRVGQLAVGQVLNADELTSWLEAWTSLREQLAQDGIVSIANDDMIPAALAPWLATLLGNLNGPGAAGIPTSLDIKSQTEAVIRKLVRSGETFEPQQPDYF